MRMLPSECNMLARMWRCGINPFLELLRKCLPASLNHLRTSMQSARSMTQLWFEIAPAFEFEWKVCLGVTAYICSVCYGACVCTIYEG
ncbi:hypothetical protein F5X96DRAFT_636729 [Biscogniauxia mediterranea]|nr:hypothetical protein F5X96DRAFT_636729 [Biscogniauxia mediterranea]